jgi:hypothetical protein
VPVILQTISFEIAAHPLSPDNSDMYRNANTKYTTMDLHILSTGRVSPTAVAIAGASRDTDSTIYNLHRVDYCFVIILITL